MNDKTRDFIEQNLNADIRQLALKGCRDKDVDLDAAILLRPLLHFDSSVELLLYRYITIFS